jgi:hypothetical protein
VLYDNILRRSRFLKADFFLFICIPELVLNFYKKVFCNFFSLAADGHCGPMSDNLSASEELLCSAAPVGFADTP